MTLNKNEVWILIKTIFIIILHINDYRGAISVLVTSLIEPGGRLELEEESATGISIAMKNAGCLGCGNAPSLSNITTTEEMFGLSSAFC